MRRSKEIYYIPSAIRGKPPFSSEQHVSWHQDVAYSRRWISNVHPADVMQSDDAWSGLEFLYDNAVSVFVRQTLLYVHVVRSENYSCRLKGIS